VPTVGQGNSFPATTREHCHDSCPFDMNNQILHQQNRKNLFLYFSYNTSDDSTSKNLDRTLPPLQIVKRNISKKEKIYREKEKK